MHSIQYYHNHRGFKVNYFKLPFIQRLLHSVARLYGCSNKKDLRRPWLFVYVLFNAKLIRAGGNSYKFDNDDHIFHGMILFNLFSGLRGAELVPYKNSYHWNNGIKRKHIKFMPNIIKPKYIS